MDEYLNIINHLELEIDPTNSDAVIISIAISLKRIADVLEHSALGDMSLRDWFAGMALMGIATNKNGYISERAEWCYKMADAILAKRVKDHA